MVFDALNSSTAQYIFFGVKFAVIIISIYLIYMFRGSPFLSIPVELLLATVSLTIHAIVELTLTGELEEVLYAVTALITSIFVVLLFVSIVSALNEMIRPNVPENDEQRELVDT